VETTVVRISKALDERLDALAVRTGRRKSFYASKAIENYLEDQEDYLLAVASYEESKGKRRYTLDEVEKRLGLEIGNRASRGKGTRKAGVGRSTAGKKVP
jgi:RHH-type transcriptional regulator, rel operon repressor / antitoxin RelB